MRLFFTAKSAKSTKENALPSGEKSLFQLRSSWFVVEICYLQFRHFGWGFAALCQGENARPFLSRPLGLRSVSYTHLDVYKRQVFAWYGALPTF